MRILVKLSIGQMLGKMSVSIVISAKNYPNMLRASPDLLSDVGDPHQKQPAPRVTVCTLEEFMGFCELGSRSNVARLIHMMHNVARD